ncbi:neutral/alkaline non-lysosomal ceramidase N-terminal domain-containing protein [Sphingobium sp. B2D3C]|uniref:neutral/alkaline non-lysosomal ceramidase N-terminal domain-containing protein n=1 Tax=Sphingobium sp. B2D3C TaxID=2940581 RepID=UPI00222515B0|nr:neutral/alkaline non-lysosomal ceramidase N-terminal domain-containing protein [Sphingobium sp. B2D3C]MCW2399241.1 hypothetical protein [Sphingobium sp. B2D3C]
MKVLVRAALFGATAFAAWGPAAAQDSAWKAGAAKVETTPDASTLSPGDIIRDPLYVRALVIANDKNCAVLVGADLIGISDAVAEQAIAQAAKITGCPQENFVVSATHTHSASGSSRLRAGAGRDAALAIVKAVTMAKAALRPATIGFGTTQVDLNINRDLLRDNRWAQGANPDGPSDKTLAILEALGEDGLPIGVYLNYAMHPINFYMSGVVSADVPGEASRYIERRYGDATVAIFAQGASGDQNPRFTRAQNRLSRVRTGVPGASDMRVLAEGQPSAGVSMADRMAALGSPVPAQRQADYLAAVEDVSQIVAAGGALLGESAIDLMHFGTLARSRQGVIAGAVRQLQCPGRDRLDRDNPVREGAAPPYADGEPVTIRAGMLKIGPVYISAINGEVYSEIGTRLKRSTPSLQLMMTSLANGSANSGYIYSDAARSHLTFQVIGSRLQPGCAEDAIVRSALEMIDELK